MSVNMHKDKYFEYEPLITTSNKVFPEWSTIISCCKAYELFPRLKICYYINKIFQIIFKNPINPEISKIFDDCIFFAFIIMLIGFLFTSIYTIFVEERQSLKDLRVKIKRSTDAIVGILRAFWILKEVKIQNIHLEDESKKIVKLMKNNFNSDNNLDGSLNEDIKNNIDCNQHDECRKAVNINIEETITNGSEGDFIIPSRKSSRHLPLSSNKSNKRINKSERKVPSEKNLAYGDPYKNHYKTNIENSAPTTPRKLVNNNNTTGGGIFNNRKTRMYDRTYI